MNRGVLCLVLCLALVSPLLAASGFEFWPGVKYDPAIPTFEKVLGYSTGDRITAPADIVRYMEALAQAVPSRMKVWDKIMFFSIYPQFF